MNIETELLNVRRDKMDVKEILASLPEEIRRKINDFTTGEELFEYAKQAGLDISADFANDMHFVDGRFKDTTPEKTVARILEILKGLNIETEIRFINSNIENCYSARVTIKGTSVGTNGKGVTKEFARASAYAEFMERLQAGLLVNAVMFSSNMLMPIHKYVHDMKWLTAEELKKTSADWIEGVRCAKVRPQDPIVSEAKVLETSEIYAGSKQMPCQPYYSIRNNKETYIPLEIAQLIYGSSGCCAGNTFEEAMVQGLSEIVERRHSLKVFTEGIIPPTIPLEYVERYPNAKKTIRSLQEHGFKVLIKDCSLGTGFPVIAATVIDEKKHKYHTHFGAHPVFEVALGRTLTELFQGRTDKNAVVHSRMSFNMAEVNATNNIRNFLVNSTGIHSARFFLESEEKFRGFEDLSNLTNRELFMRVKKMFLDQGYDILVRDHSYLGFTSMHIIVPGYSEVMITKLKQLFPERQFSLLARDILRNYKKASPTDWYSFVMLTKYYVGCKQMDNSFRSYSGIPIENSGTEDWKLYNIYLGHGNYVLGNIADAEKCAGKAALYEKDEEMHSYYLCVQHYLSCKRDGVDRASTDELLRLFYPAHIVERLERRIDAGESPFEEGMFICDFDKCEECKYHTYCSYQTVKRISETIGEYYRTYGRRHDAEGFYHLVND